MDHGVCPKIRIEEVDGLQHRVVEAVGFNRKLQHLQHRFLPMVRLQAALMDPLQVVISSGNAQVRFKLHRNTVLLAHHVLDRVKELLFAHLFYGRKDIEPLRELIDLRALLGEHLAHFENLLAQVFVS